MPRKLTRAEQRKMAARDRLVEEHLEWALGIAKALAAKLPTWFTEDDLSGPAEIGLIQAATRYDATKNDNFRGYAWPRVHGACIASIRRREYKERGHMSIDALPREEGSNPKEQPAGSWQEWADRQGPQAVDRGPDELLQDAKEGAFAFVWQLPVRHQRVITLYYQQGMNLEEIGRYMSISQSLVCRIHREALVLLREAMERKNYGGSHQYTKAA